MKYVKQIRLQDSETLGKQLKFCSNLLVGPLDLSAVLDLRLGICGNKNKLFVENYRNVNPFSSEYRLLQYKISSTKQKKKNLFEWCVDYVRVHSLCFKSILPNKYDYFRYNIKNTEIINPTDPTEPTIYSIKCRNYKYVLSYWNTPTTFSCNILVGHVQSGKTTQSQMFEHSFIDNPKEVVPNNTKNANKLRTILDYVFPKKIPVKRISLSAYNYKITENGIVFKGNFVGERISFLLFYSFEGNFIYYPTNVDILRTNEILFTPSLLGFTYIFIREREEKQYLVYWNMETNTKGLTIDLNSNGIYDNLLKHYFLRLIGKDYLVIGSVNILSGTIAIRWLNVTTDVIEDITECILNQ